MSDETKPLRWTSEPPKVPGWYWLRARRGQPFMHKVFQEELGKPNAPGVMIAGPIPEPIDAAQVEGGGA